VLQIIPFLDRVFCWLNLAILSVLFGLEEKLHGGTFAIEIERRMSSLACLQQVYGVVDDQNFHWKESIDATGRSIPSYDVRLMKAKQKVKRSDRNFRHHNSFRKPIKIRKFTTRNNKL
jgi:hypothetical protein